MRARTSAHLRKAAFTGCVRCCRGPSVPHGIGPSSDRCIVQSPPCSKPGRQGDAKECRAAARTPSLQGGPCRATVQSRWPCGSIPGSSPGIPRDPRGTTSNRASRSRTRFAESFTGRLRDELLNASLFRPRANCWPSVEMTSTVRGDGQGP
jgi:hypothetical protein